jgi:hypothetical protein
MSWIASLLLAMPLLAMAGDSAVSLDFAGSAWVDVDAAGKAHVVEMGGLSRLDGIPEMATIAASIRERLRARIESWQFTPALRDGTAVASSTNVYVNLEASDDGAGGLAVRLRSAYTGPKLEDRNMGGLLMADTGEEGVVVIEVAFGENGHVQSVTAVDARAFEGGQFVSRVSQDLRKGSVRAAKRWVIRPEQVAGHPVAGSGRVPVLFCSTQACDAAWRGSDDPDSQPRYASSEPVAKLSGSVAGMSL